MDNDACRPRSALSDGLGLAPERDALALACAAAREAQEMAANYAEELACVRQALPAEWRNSVPSVAVATLVAELDTLRQRFYTTRCPSAHLCDCQEAGQDCARGYKVLADEGDGPQNDVQAAFGGIVQTAQG